MVDAFGNPVDFLLTGGQVHDLAGADHLLASMQANLLIADKALDADARVIERLAAAGKTAVIPPKANRRVPRNFDKETYKARHLIENFFARLKQYRASPLATTRPPTTSWVTSTSLAPWPGFIDDTP